MKKILLVVLAVICSLTYGQSQQNTTTIDVEIKQVDSLTFFSLKETANQQKETIEVVTDITEARKLLKGVVVWAEISDDDWKPYESEKGELVYRINYRNGEVFAFDRDDFDEQYFVAYYPKEDILLLEGGHTTDVSYNLSTGETTEDTGNPNYFVSSPAKTYRLNGCFGGQECSSYFIQKKEGKWYKKVVQLNSAFESIQDAWLCTIGDSFWSNDTTLNFSTVIYTKYDGQKLYYQVILND